MPDPVGQIVETTEPQAWDPPAGDIDFDSLFQPELQNVAPVATHEPATEPQVEAQPQVETPTTPPEFFLETETGTRYKDIAEAKRGTEEKDRLLNDLRGKMIALTGVDPLKRNAQATQPRQNQSYLNDAERYAQDLTEAATSKRYGDYRDAQVRLIDEYLQTRYGHLLPRVEKMGRQEALDDVSEEIPAFKTFYGSEDYQKALERHPRLKEAIQASESNPAYQESHLPDLYKTVWDVSVAVKASEPQRASQNASIPTQTPRMPMQSQSRPNVQVPDMHSQGAVKPGMATSAGRKALMAELEAKGIKDMAF